MSKYVFINRNWPAIRKLIVEIGQYEYDNQFELMGLGQQKPISKDGFYLECNMDCIFLCYRYPSKYDLRIMKVDRYDNVPKVGWIIYKETGELNRGNRFQNAPSDFTPEPRN